MSKFLNVPYGDYTITVQDGGIIRLDTGVENGEVVVTGDLTVLGVTTTIDTVNMTVEDNIITLNSGEDGPGVTLNQAGIEIDRGAGAVNQQFVFDETINYTSPTLGAISGAWHTKDINGDLVGIRTNVIDTAGGDLYLVNSGTGKISVTGTTAYEQQVFYYSGGVLQVLDPFEAANPASPPDPDNIPNAQAVVDFVNGYFTSVFYDRIAEGTVTPTYVETKDQEVTGQISRVEIGVDGTIAANFYDDRLDLSDLRLQSSRIESTDTDQDLVLVSSGSGSIRINDTLHINATPTFEDGTLDPSSPADGIKLYSKSPGYGNTGLYFANSASESGEVISNNRALIYSMLF